MRSLFLSVVVSLVAFPLVAFAQFEFFQDMFGNQGGHQQHQQPQQRQNMPSDSSWYRENYENAPCTNYLCPGTLSCVHFPHHCPCAFPAQEDKFELGESGKVCLSKGGWKAGEAARKVELARKGLL